MQVFLVPEVPEASDTEFRSARKLSPGLSVVLRVEAHQSQSHS
jgi:hypothetical protein